MSSRPVRLAVLVSGGGTNLQALLDAQREGRLAPGEIVAVFSNRANAHALERAKNAGIAARAFSIKDYPGTAWEKAVLDALSEASVDMIVLAGFLRVLSADFLKACHVPVLNIHPALLPAFGGRGYYGEHVHEAVLAHRVQVTGATVHLVTAQADAGPILAQQAVRVLADDTPERLQQRVMREAEWKLLPACVHAMACRLRNGLTGKALSAPLSEAEYAAFLPSVQSGSRATEKAPSLATLLRGNPYPGRGIALAHGTNGNALIAYFIMGRSQNSQNRVFHLEGNDLYTQAHDPALLEDPSLIIYRALSHTRVAGEPVTVVTNGDHTDTLLDGLAVGKDFDTALQSRTFEPDGPHFTPRISGLLAENHLQLSIWKAADANGTNACYQAFHYNKEPGTGRFISTYVTDGNPLPSFQGEPLRFSWDGDAAAFTAALWDALSPENRIALYVEEHDGASVRHFIKSRFS